MSHADPPSLRAFSLRTVGLICIWCFYYPGSQPTIHEFTASNSERHADFSMWIAGFSAASRFREEVPPYKLAMINSNFTRDIASISNGLNPAVLSRCYDIARNPYVPWLFNLHPKRSLKDWWKFTRSDIKNFIPISYEAIQQNTNQSSSNLVGSYDTEMSYLQVGCDALEMTYSPDLNLSSTRSLVLVPTDDDQDRVAKNSGYARGFHFYSKAPQGFSHTTCNVTMVTAELEIQCTHGNCGRR